MKYEYHEMLPIYKRSSLSDKMKELFDKQPYLANLRVIRPASAVIN